MSVCKFGMYQLRSCYVTCTRMYTSFMNWEYFQTVITSATWILFHFYVNLFPSPTHYFRYYDMAIFVWCSWFWIINVNILKTNSKSIKLSFLDTGRKCPCPGCHWSKVLIEDRRIAVWNRRVHLHDEPNRGIRRRVMPGRERKAFKLKTWKVPIWFVPRLVKNFCAATVAEN